MNVIVTNWKSFIILIPLKQLIYQFDAQVNDVHILTALSNMAFMNQLKFMHLINKFSSITIFTKQKQQYYECTKNFFNLC